MMKEQIKRIQCIDVSRTVSRRFGEAFGKLPDFMTVAIVGGAVRDSVLGIVPDDFDFVIALNGHESDVIAELQKISSAFVKQVVVGKPVFEIVVNGTKLDVKIEPLSMVNALGSKDRDFTMNAIAVEIGTGRVFDPHNGIEDIRRGVIKLVSEDGFAVSNERVLRMIGFVARLGFDVDGRTLELAKEAELDKIFVSQRRLHLRKMFRKGVHIVKAMEVWKDSGFIRFFPELENLIGLEQDTKNHPERFVWEHSIMTAEEAVRLSRETGIDPFIPGITGLLHDTGKKDATKVVDGKIVSWGHESVTEHAVSFLKKMGIPDHEIRPVVRLTKTHMFHFSVQGKPRRKVVNKLVDKLGKGVSLEQWFVVVEADHSARPPKPKKAPASAIAIMEKAAKMEEAVEPVKSIIDGRVLIDMGITPKDFENPSIFGQVLREIREGQLDEAFVDLEGGKEFASRVVKRFIS